MCFGYPVTSPTEFLCLSPTVSLPPVSAVSPLKPDRFEHELRGHPDRGQVRYVLEGLRTGFRLGFTPVGNLKSAKRNKPTAYKHGGVIDSYLADEVRLGRGAGPFLSPPVTQVAYQQLQRDSKKGSNRQMAPYSRLILPQGA